MCSSDLLALALAAELGVSVAAARRGLAACRPAKGRLQHEALGGIHLIDDTYNANPASMRAAFGTLAALPVVGRRIVVVGDMAELGVHAGPAHVGVGQDARELGMDMVFATGNHAAQVQAGAAGGRTAFRTCPDVAATVAVLLEEARAGDALLFKASRSSRLERVVEGLKAVLVGKRGPATGVQ